jgi:1-deoxy-D-xylulose-5-phosphate synthase
MQALELGRGIVRREGREVAILAFGAMLHPALAAAQQLDATVADMRFVKPIDGELIERLAATHERLVTVEENVVTGGAGSAVAEHLSRRGIAKAVLQLGLPDRFVEHGDSALLLRQCGLDAAGLIAAIRPAG